MAEAKATRTARATKVPRIAADADPSVEMVSFTMRITAKLNRRIEKALAREAANGTPRNRTDFIRDAIDAALVKAERARSK